MLRNTFASCCGTYCTWIFLDAQLNDRLTDGIKREATSIEMNQISTLLASRAFLLCFHCLIGRSGKSHTVHAPVRISQQGQMRILCCFLVAADSREIFASEQIGGSRENRFGGHRNRCYTAHAIDQMNTRWRLDRVADRRRYPERLWESVVVREAERDSPVAGAREG